MKVNETMLKKRLNSKIRMQMLFGLGGAVVILGALFKILHLEIGPITGGAVLGLGLGTEALIFTAMAFNTGEIKEEHAEFVKKVKSGALSGGGSPQNTGLSAKIDQLMQEAKLDVQLMQRLTKSVQDLESSAKAMAPSSALAAASKSYSEELTKASSQVKQLNSFYGAHTQNVRGNVDFNKEMVKNAQKLQAQMEKLSQNLAVLNQVYGGMLTAMNKK